MDKSEVRDAIEFLLEALEKTQKDISKDISDASEKMDFEKAKCLSEMGERIGKFYKKIKELKTEWINLSYENLNLKLFEKKGKLKKGLRTKQKDFYIPILETLIELGGKGTTKEVLEKVYEKMKNRLNKYDLEPLPSDPKTIRWKNTAQWAKNDMVKDGLISSKSEKGIWEITQKGINFLKKI